MLLVFLLILGYECPDCFKLAKTFYLKLLFRKKSRVQGEITRPAYPPSDDYSKHLPLAAQNAKKRPKYQHFQGIPTCGCPELSFPAFHINRLWNLRRFPYQSKLNSTCTVCKNCALSRSREHDYDHVDKFLILEETSNWLANMRNKVYQTEVNCETANAAFFVPVVRRDFPWILYLPRISYIAFKYSLWRCS